MIGISKLYCATVEPSDALRYSRDSGTLPSHLLQFSADKKPVVVWNMTRRCNLKCVHCYAQSEDLSYDNELNREQSLAMIDDLLWHYFVVCFIVYYVNEAVIFVSRYT